MSKFIQVPVSLEKSNPKEAQKIKDEGWKKYIDRMPIYSIKGKEINKLDNVTRVLTFPETSPSGIVEHIKEFDYTHNLVTNDGEIFYAIQGAGETPAVCEQFCMSDAVFAMGSANMVEAETDTYGTFSAVCGNPIACSQKAYTACFPLTDCMCADNMCVSTQVISYSVCYTTGDFNDCDIEHGVIFDDTTPACATKLLSTFSFTLFAKTACDTLKVFVNHTFENV